MYQDYWGYFQCLSLESAVTCKEVDVTIFSKQLRVNGVEAIVVCVLVCSCNLDRDAVV